MEHVTHSVEDFNDLKALLTIGDLLTRADGAKSILVQIYTSKHEEHWLKSLSCEVKKAFPAAVIVGASTSGEVIHGETVAGKTLIAFSFFRSSSIVPIASVCPLGEEREVGCRIGKEIECCNDIAGVLLLATSLSIDTYSLLQGLAESTRDYPFFGGSAGDRYVNMQSMIICDSDVFAQGVVAVVLSGTELHIEPVSYLGWKAFSKEMTITETDGRLVKTVDGEPAFNIYQRYLNIANDENFFRNAIGFSFLLQRNHGIIARVPFVVDDNGGVQFVADVHCGEKFRIGYADPVMIIDQAQRVHNRMLQFEPDAIFLYTCSARRFLLQHDVQLETLPFEKIAPTLGFYTAGEYFGRSPNLQLLNSTMVVVGIREGERSHNNIPVIETEKEKIHLCAQDSVEYKDTRVIARLIHFIKIVTDELEQANKELAKLAATDKLTQVYNRVKTDDILKRELSRAERYNSKFSIIMLDVDHFKLVNDVYGHAVGDKILIEVANSVKNTISRESDVIGRWGGEEFLVVLPETDCNQARFMAERLCTSIANQVFSAGIKVTCSLGVTAYNPGDTEHSILVRADKALYEAKCSGRNRVVVKMPE